jgi:hypothetical protein
MPYFSPPNVLYHPVARRCFVIDAVYLVVKLDCRKRGGHPRFTIFLVGCQAVVFLAVPVIRAKPIFAFVAVGLVQTADPVVFSKSHASRTFLQAYTVNSRIMAVVS